MTTTAIIVAAGRGTRAGGGVPKQYRALAGRPVIAWTIAALRPWVQQVVIVHHPADLARLEALDLGAVTLTPGADTRDGSVRAGLAAVDPGCTRVLIHDAARPLVSDAVIQGVVAALDTHTAAAPAVAVTDALWTGADDRVTGTQDRSGLFRAQTPQGFHLEAIRAAHAALDRPAADDVEVARLAGLEVAITPGSDDNLKITLPEDFARAARLLKDKTPMDIRLGNGYDVHRFGPGDHVILCGVKIPHERSLQGHSDADVGMHTVTDAIYGALAMGDIGQHFPPSDPQWKGAASEIFLRHACALAREKGYEIGNVDCTLVCEFPKIGPHALEMRAEMARLMGMEMDRVSVKATTSERLGFTGRGEGIACLATVTLVKP